MGILRRVSTALLALAALGLTCDPATAQPLTIENAALIVKYDAGRFTLTAKPSQLVFVKDGQLSVRNGTAKLVAVTDKTFGAGQAIETSDAGGQRDTISVFPGVPFALFQSRLHNGGNEAIVTKSVRPFSATVALGEPASVLTTLGTGGLLAPDKNPGSYVWLAVAEPQSRRGVVTGWLTHDRGSGVVFSKVEDGQVRVDGQLDYGRLRAAPGQTTELETLAVGYFDDARLGLEAWADAVAKVYDIKLRPQPVGYCTWYSKPHGGASDQEHLAELSAFAATNLAPFGFSVVQIDDGWQAGISTNGPKRGFAAHNPKGPYSSGMKSTADQLKSLGLTPGIWFMPFAGTWYDPLFKDHQDWFVKRADGRPFETAWGGTCLDMTQPGAQAYLRDYVSRMAKDWGFQYFKMDGLSTGVGVRPQYVNTGYKDDQLGEGVLSNPDKSNPEAFRDGLRLVRDAVGPDVFFLGCCAPQNMRSYGGAFGLVDAMRIGPDNGASWSGLLRGPTFGSRQYFLNGRVWYNDPDPVYVRTNLPLKQAQLICSWVALSGQLNFSSDWLPGLPPERLDILKRTMPNHGLKPRPVDLFESPLPRIWLLTDDRQSPRRDVIGLFNWSDREETFDVALDRIGLAGGAEYAAFDFWQNTPLPPLKGRLQLTVPPQSCRILAVRPRLDRPQLISTSRHITQGIVDVRNENWEVATRSLSGRSQVVGGDPYELRIAVPDGGSVWKAALVELSPADQAAGVTAGVKTGEGLVRVQISSPVSRDIAWRVKFAQP